MEDQPADAGPVDLQRWDLRRFYSELQERAGAGEQIALIEQWEAARIDQLVALLEPRALAMIGQEVPHLLVRPDGRVRSNQSRGNTVADYIGDRLGSPDLAVLKARGQGYPDMIAKIGDDFTCCLELKATSDWRDGDVNRRVLTSSAKKLKSLIKAGTIVGGPYHLLITGTFDPEHATIRAIRLDFLEPDSLVNVRLEASTSQSFLARGTHRSRTIGG